MKKAQTMCWVCPRIDHHDISMFVHRNGCWYKEKDYPKNPHRLIQLVCSQDESILIATFTTGYILWHVNVVSEGIGKKHAFKKYDQTSSLWGSTGSNITPVVHFHKNFVIQI